MCQRKNLSVLLLFISIYCVQSRPSISEWRFSKISTTGSHKHLVKKSSLTSYLRWQKVPEERTQVVSGSSQVLECEAAGSPPPEIFWLKDGQRIDKEASKLLYNGANDLDAAEAQIGLSATKARLFLDCVHPSDQASYTCVAKSSFGEIRATTWVKVIGDQSECRDFRELQPARISMWTRTRLEKLGSSVNLFCRTQDSNPQQIKWVGPEGKELVDPRFKVMLNGDLLISNLSWDDLGTYTCLVANQLGLSKVESFLYPTQPE